VQCNPASPYRWCDLAEGLLDAGRSEAGERSIARAVELGPKMPQILLRAANFEFRNGADEAAARYAARVLALTRDYDGAVFGSYSRFGISQETILKDGIPDDRDARLAYFQFVLAGGDARQAALVWIWMRRQPPVDDRAAVQYVDFLMGHGLYEAAAAAWAEQTESRDAAYRHSNFLFNGNYLLASSNSALDWHIHAVPGVEATRVACDAAPRAQCLKINFLDAGNPEYRDVAEAVVVEPGLYRFHTLGRAAGITTDEGVGFRIVDREDAGRLDVRTGQLRGQTPWTTLTADVRVPGGTRIVDVQVYRPRSGSFDNRIRGTVWFTDVTLARAEGTPPK
jgi:hypothetical protein